MKEQKSPNLKSPVPLPPDLATLPVIEAQPCFR
jgi:hypothetical protein